MSFTILLFVACCTTFGTIYLINYLNLASRINNRIWSPRLLVCKILAPADVVLTLILNFGFIFGLITVATGISTMVYAALTGVGFSAGVALAKKYFIPRWQLRFEEIKIKFQQTGILETR